MSDFPTLSKGQDSQYYEMTLEDPAMRAEMEGGYVYSRPRHTRRPRRIFTTGFSDITEEDRQTLLDFWDEMGGSSQAFSWTDPTDEKIYLVRFAGEPLVFKYRGAGDTRRYDCPSIKLEEV